MKQKDYYYTGQTIKRNQTNLNDVATALLKVKLSTVTKYTSNISTSNPQTNFRLPGNTSAI